MSKEVRYGAGGLHFVTAAPPDSDTDDEDAMEELRAKLTQSTALPGCAPHFPAKSQICIPSIRHLQLVRVHRHHHRSEWKAMH